MIVNTYVLNLSETGALIGAGINSIARKALTITLFFIGASLSRDVLKAVGIKPLVQGILLWVVISVSSLAYIIGLYIRLQRLEDSVWYILSAFSVHFRQLAYTNTHLAIAGMCISFIHPSQHRRTETNGT